MKVLKRQLNNPWIKDVSTAGVQGLDSIEGCYSSCWCQGACDQLCAFNCAHGADAFDAYWSGSNSCYQTSYNSYSWLC